MFRLGFFTVLYLVINSIVSALYTFMRCFFTILYMVNYHGLLPTVVIISLSEQRNTTEHNRDMLAHIPNRFRLRLANNQHSDCWSYTTTGKHIVAGRHSVSAWCVLF